MERSRQGTNTNTWRERDSIAGSTGETDFQFIRLLSELGAQTEASIASYGSPSPIMAFLGPGSCGCSASAACTFEHVNKNHFLGTCTPYGCTFFFSERIDKNQLFSGPVAFFFERIDKNQLFLMTCSINKNQLFSGRVAFLQGIFVSMATTSGGQ